MEFNSVVVVEEIDDTPADLAEDLEEFELESPPIGPMNTGNQISFKKEFRQYLKQQSLKKAQEIK